jgi:hypothetical protein
MSSDIHHHPGCACRAVGVAMTRIRLSDRRYAETVALEHNGTQFMVTIGFYPDGRPGEVFTHGVRSGSQLDVALSAKRSVINTRAGGPQLKCGKPAIGAVFKRATIGREFRCPRDWRRECDWEPKASEFVAIILLGGVRLGSNCGAENIAEIGVVFCGNEAAQSKAIPSNLAFFRWEWTWKARARPGAFHPSAHCFWSNLALTIGHIGA